MNLSAMSLDELARLQSALVMIHKGAAILAGLPVNQDETELTIDMTPGEIVMISTHFAMPGFLRAFGPPPDFELVEPSLDVIETEQGRFFPHRCGRETANVDGDGGDVKPGGLVDLQQLENVDGPPADPGQRQQNPVLDGAAGEPQAGAMPATEMPAAGGATILGPMREDEKAAVREMAARGLSAHEIAASINRRVQTIASVLRAKPKEATGQPVPAGVPASDAAAPISSPVAVQDEIPETPAAEANAAPADTGQPALSREAGVTAPQAGGAASAQSEVQVRMTAAQRRLNAYLDDLGYRRGWSPEDDLALVHGLGAGFRLPELCIDLGFDPKDAHQRFGELSLTIRDDRGRPSIDGQADLLVVLRLRAAPGPDAQIGEPVL